MLTAVTRTLAPRLFCARQLALRPALAFSTAPSAVASRKMSGFTTVATPDAPAAIVG